MFSSIPVGISNIMIKIKGGRFLLKMRTNFLAITDVQKEGGSRVVVSSPLLEVLQQRLGAAYVITVKRF